MKYLLFCVLFIGLLPYISCKLMSYEDCSSKQAIGRIKDFTFEPNPMQAGRNTTCLGEGSVHEAITEGAHFELLISYNGFVVSKRKGSLCKDSVVNMPFHAGEIYVTGVNCPMKAGDLSLVELARMNYKPIKGMYSLKMIAYNGDDKEIICTKIDIPM
eukprot:TRINITY_DN774130_c0_g1_i1.p1 TRINITY_DN774130_c0_g1~~TRINITY_DN774130_c0_g1_i1.p1  ORF type:complete len:158 (-),score=26.37 TRINITY_DN774130_c0_g1_i1:289-762(-)